VGSPVAGMSKEVLPISSRPENMICLRDSHGQLLRPESNPAKSTAVALSARQLTD